jgi:hypothetical protein
MEVFPQEIVRTSSQIILCTRHVFRTRFSGVRLLCPGVCVPLAFIQSPKLLSLIFLHSGLTPEFRTLHIPHSSPLGGLWPTIHPTPMHSPHQTARDTPKSSNAWNPSMASLTSETKSRALKQFCNRSQAHPDVTHGSAPLAFTLRPGLTWASSSAWRKLFSTLSLSSWVSEPFSFNSLFA